MELAATIKNLGKVSNVRRDYQSRRMSKLEIESSLDAFELALALEDSQAPVLVAASSTGRILATWAPEHSFRLKLLLTSVPGRLPNGLKWLKNAMNKMILSELENISFLDAKATEELSSGKAVAQVVKRLVSHESTPALVAISRVSKAGKGLIAEVAVYDGSKGKKLCSVIATGKAGEVASLAHGMVEKLAGKILRKATRKKSIKLLRGSRVYKTLLTQNRRKDMPVQIDTIRIDDIFPSRLGYYVDNPVGKLKLRRSKKQKISQIKVSVFLPGFMKLPWEKVVENIDGAKIEVPLKVTLDASRVFSVDENSPAQAEVKVSFRTKDGTGTLRRVVALMVFDKNAIDWRVPESAASFVTARDKGLSQFARNAVNITSPKSLPEAVSKAAFLFEAIRLMNLKYLKDPVNPSRNRILDYVQ